MVGRPTSVNCSLVGWCPPRASDRRMAGFAEAQYGLTKCCSEIQCLMAPMCTSDRMPPLDDPAGFGPKRSLACARFVAFHRASDWLQAHSRKRPDQRQASCMELRCPPPKILLSQDCKWAPPQAKYAWRSAAFAGRIKLDVVGKNTTAVRPHGHASVLGYGRQSPAIWRKTCRHK
jgi:hypothetical protein